MAYALEERKKQTYNWKITHPAKESLNWKHHHFVELIKWSTNANKNSQPQRGLFLFSKQNHNRSLISLIKKKRFYYEKRKWNIVAAITIFEIKCDYLLRLDRRIKPNEQTKVVCLFAEWMCVCVWMQRKKRSIREKRVFIYYRCCFYLIAFIWRIRPIIKSYHNRKY